MAIGGKIGAGAGRPFKGEVPSVAFGNHIIAVLGLAGHCGHWWENRLRRGEAFQGRGAVKKIGSGAARPFKGEVPSVAFGNHVIAVLGIGGKIGAGAARPFKGEVPSVAFGNHIIAVLGMAGFCGHW